MSKKIIILDRWRSSVICARKSTTYRGDESKNEEESEVAEERLREVRQRSTEVLMDAATVKISGDYPHGLEPEAVTEKLGPDQSKELDV